MKGEIVEGRKNLEIKSDDERIVEKMRIERIYKDEKIIV